MKAYTAILENPNTRTLYPLDFALDTDYKSPSAETIIKAFVTHLRTAVKSDFRDNVPVLLLEGHQTHAVKGGARYGFGFRLTEPVRLFHPPAKVHERSVVADPTREGHYTYRGIAIHRSDDLRGGWGHWRATGDIHFRAATRRELLAALDRELDAQKTAQTA